VSLKFAYPGAHGGVPTRKEAGVNAICEPAKSKVEAGGLYLSGEDLAKIGYLYLHDGAWDGKQIVSKEWVKESVTPFIKAEEDYQYGFKWWLMPLKNSQQYVWMERGLGGQELLVFPENQMIVVFTGWDISGSAGPEHEHEYAARVLAAMRTKSCGAQTH